MEDCNKVCSPIIPGRKLVKDEKGKATNVTSYKKMIDSLMCFLATTPYMTFYACLVARYIERPTELHVVAVKRILKYFKGTLSFGILYRCKTDGDLMMQGWTSSDYASDHDDRKSTTDYVFTQGLSVVCWSSKKQPIVTLSVTGTGFMSEISSPVSVFG